VNRTHFIKGIVDILPQFLIHLNPIIGFEAFGWKWGSLRGASGIHLNLDVVARPLERDASADRGVCNETGAELAGDWERESGKGLEDGGLSCARVANNYNLWRSGQRRY
jgi:hypothetical protein